MLVKPRLILLIAFLCGWASPVSAQELDPVFAQHDAAGTIVIERLSDRRQWTANPERAQQRFLPASTFKIPNTMILLSSGVIGDPDSDIIVWDGVERGGGWDQDQSLRTAFRRSAYWAYSALTRQAGDAHMARMVTLFGYGNENTGSAEHAGTFWLEGPLTISAHEQIGFLSRLHARTLPVEPAHMETVIDLMELERGENWVLRGKTGWGQPDGQPDIGWFVGWLETEADIWLFAVNIDMIDPDRHRELRRVLAEEALETVTGLDLSPDD